MEDPLKTEQARSSKAEAKRQKRALAAAQRRERCIAQCESLTTRVEELGKNADKVTEIFDELAQLSHRLFDAKLSRDELLKASTMYKAALLHAEKCSRKQAHKLREWNTTMHLRLTSSADQSCTDTVGAEVDLDLGEGPKRKKQRLGVNDESAEAVAAMIVSIVSFGHKNGKPVNMDRVFDIRAVPPLKRAIKKNHTSLEENVYSAVFEATNEKGKERVEKIYQHIRSQISASVVKHVRLHDASTATPVPPTKMLNFAIGCNSGHHRSVSLWLKQLSMFSCAIPPGCICAAPSCGGMAFQSHGAAQASRCAHAQTLSRTGGGGECQAAGPWAGSFARRGRGCDLLIRA
jgi:hypothetical protein